MRRDDDSAATTAFLRRATRAGTLDPDDERALARACASGDSDAREQLVVTHLRWVVSLARPYEGLGVGIGDLVQEGVVGLLEALRRFDPERGVRLTTYATPWVRDRIGRTVSRRRPVHLPARVEREVLAVREALAELGRAGGVDSPHEHVARSLGCGPERVAWLLSLGATSVASLEDVPPQRQSVAGPDADEAVLHGADVAVALDALESRLRAVVERRFGFDGEGRRSASEVAAELGCSPAEVRRRERRAFTALRRHPALRAYAGA